MWWVARRAKSDDCELGPKTVIGNMIVCIYHQILQRSGISAGQGGGHRKKHRLGLAPRKPSLRDRLLSHSLLATCYDPLHAKNGPISICGCKLPPSGRDTSRFYGTALGGCCDVVATTKTWFSQKVNARHPLEISRERSSKNLVVCSQPEISSLRKHRIRC